MSMEERPRHVAIIGGGIIGCSTAYFLTQLGHTNITIFEQCDIACHSSGKAGGFLAKKWCDETDLRELARASYQIHTQLASEFPDLDYRCVDTYKVVTSQKKVNLKTENPIKWLTEGNIEEVEMLETSENSAKVSPKPLCHKLLAEAKLKGAVVSFSRVTGVLTESSKVTALRVSNKDVPISVDAVVVAAGPWSTEFLHEHFPSYPLPQLPPQTRAHSVLLEPTVQVDAQCIFQYHRSDSGVVDPEIYPQPNGTVYICGEVDKVPLPASPDLIAPDLASCRELVRQASFAAGCLKDAKVVASQACYLPDSHDHLPLIGAVPGFENVFVGTGHTFWGILNGPATGKCLAELITSGRASTCDLTPFDPSRFM